MLIEQLYMRKQLHHDLIISQRGMSPIKWAYPRQTNVRENWRGNQECTIQSYWQQ